MFNLKRNGISGSLRIFENYLQNRYQRVGRPLTLVCHRDPYLGLFFFLLLYMDDLPTIPTFFLMLMGFTKLLTGHTRKMVFNPDITKQAIELIFSSKKKSLNTHSLFPMVYQSHGKIIPNIWEFTWIAG